MILPIFDNMKQTKADIERMKQAAEAGNKMAKFGEAPPDIALLTTWLSLPLLVR